MNTLQDIIAEHGGPAIAKACGVSRGAPLYWMRLGRLPLQPPARGKAYAKAIAKLAGVEAKELLEQK
jgi:hypothetical protein